MRLSAAQVMNYRSVLDSSRFEVELDKTILVGPNEAGKTAVLRALQTVNPPDDTDTGLEALRDYPRSRYTDLIRDGQEQSEVAVARAVFTLDADDLAALHEADPDVFADAQTFELTRYLDNRRTWSLPDVTRSRTYKDVEKDLTLLKTHLAGREGGPELVRRVEALLSGARDNTALAGDLATRFEQWLNDALPALDEDDEKTQSRFDRIRAAVRHNLTWRRAGEILIPRAPVFVYYSQYFTVRPRIHLANLARRQASGEIDEGYDFGNLCLLDLLGFTAQELADMESIPAPGLPPNPGDHQAMAEYRAAEEKWQAQRDDRHYRLNAAGVALTGQIRAVWGDQNLQLRLNADGQYLKVVVVDDLGVEVELDQRSEGFRWLVSFFTVFRAQAKDDLKNAILLLDEPGLHLHPLKQREFRRTVDVLAEDNQIIYTTHSPFMVGPEELQRVRVVEMVNRATGTKVHTRLVSDDPRSVFPLQAALGYDLAQSLFSHRRNLVCEGLTDMWFLEGVANAMRDAGVPTMREDIATVPAQSATKVVYYCTLLHSQNLKVAALLDSDASGEKAATQDDLVRLLGKNQILRTKDFLRGQVHGPEVEDLLRDTLVRVALDTYGWDVTTTAGSQPHRRIVDIFTAEVPEFTKYRLGKAFLTWLGSHGWTDLTTEEREAWEVLFAAVNKGLK